MRKLSSLKKLKDPGLAEFIYTVATTVPLSAKRLLPEKLYNKIRTPKTARTFAKTATENEKREFLGCLGYRTITLISNHDTIWSPQLKEILRPYTSTTSVKKIDDLIDESIYLIGDKKLFYLLCQQSDIMDSPIYKKQVELIRSKKGNLGWPPKLGDNEPGNDAALAFLRIIYSGIEDLIFCEQQFNIAPIEFKALLYFFFKRNEYVDYNEITVQLIGFANMKASRQVIRELLCGMYIQDHFDPRIKSYTITPRGIKAVMDFCERSIIKLTQAA